MASSKPGDRQPIVQLDLGEAARDVHLTAWVAPRVDGRVPLTLIRGSYQVLGASPDGDSVRFTPDDPQGWAKAGIAARVNATGGAQLRLDAIDALETIHHPRRPRHRP